MRTELRLRPHSIRIHHNVVEIWHGGQFIGQVVGSEEPGVLIITKYPIPKAGIVTDNEISVAEVRIEYR